MELYYRILYLTVLLLLAVGLLLSLIRTIRGPRVADRIVGVNIIGTLGALLIVVLTLLLDESYVMDVALIYCLISFLAVVVLARIYISVGATKKRTEQAAEETEGDTNG